jgi:hypothetical protein
VRRNNAPVGILNMNIEICKKHLVGKPVAFTAGNLNTIYRGVIVDVIEDAKWHGGSLILVPSKEANFCHVRVFAFVDGILHSFKKNEEAEGEPMCEEPIIEGAVPVGSIMKVIFREEKEANQPPARPSVRGLIESVGTFTGCKELMDKFVTDGHIRKDGQTLHVDFSISDQPGCMCGFATQVEHIESVTRDLKQFFSADEIIYHHSRRVEGNFVTVEVEPGHKGQIRNLPGALKGDPWCGTYPVIKGLNMRWEAAPAKE